MGNLNKNYMFKYLGKFKIYSFPNLQFKILKPMDSLIIHVCKLREFTTLVYSCL